ncbi:hypothetical protein HPB52_014621 [Rhipicephalus sanguineus]|uniref:AB hydrolase-1 domain-containing protein n=1 Tax=Rhipicephalus sanguineus TaxID=34632 RepID=A0A9D4Q6T6_RHISA|nr:hypothetical protein HPB52_014621 [Rhipicephalus sanguineus]
MATCTPRILDRQTACRCSLSTTGLITAPHSTLWFPCWTRHFEWSPWTWWATGASSNLPRGYQYSHQQFVEDIDDVLDYLGWSYCAILAHGVGATMALYYAGLRPDVCTGVVSLSMSDTVNTHPGHMLPTLVQHIEASGNLEYQKADKETMDTVVRDLVDVTGGSLDEDSARVLLGAEDEAGQTLQLAVLSRCLKVYTLSETKKDALTIQNTMTLYRGPLLMVSAKDWCDDDEEGMLRICEDFFRTSCDPFVKLEVDGTHHVHLNNPGLVSSHVSDFLRKSCDLSCPFPCLRRLA